MHSYISTQYFSCQYKNTKFLSFYIDFHNYL
nr:MAG TPA_asm: hypothetical protein [Caudoviricetes sp.]